MQVEKNNQVMDKKHFLMRQLFNHIITEEQYNKDIEPLEKEIAENLKEALIEVKTEIKSEIETIKETVFNDGNFKRSIASIIIKLLEKDLTDAELKGVFRQGYKIMRSRS